MEAAFCVETLQDAPARHGKPDVFDTDQGSQFTGQTFTGVLADSGIAARRIKPTSTRCHSAWQPDLGRGSTYRRGKSVQTTGITSLTARFLCRIPDICAIRLASPSFIRPLTVTESVVLPPDRRTKHMPENPGLHHARIDPPRCPKCHDLASLVGITTGPRGLNLRSLECNKCDQVITVSSEISR